MEMGTPLVAHLIVPPYVRHSLCDAVQVQVLASRFDDRFTSISLLQLKKTSLAGFFSSAIAPYTFEYFLAIAGLGLASFSRIFLASFLLFD